MPITRRDLLKAGASASALALIPPPLLIRLGELPEPVPPIQDRRFKELALAAIEAAQAAGALYSDVRLTHTRERAVNDNDVHDSEAMVVGVRALVRGYWGFASGPVWSREEMVRLGREAVHQATTNTLGKSRDVVLTPVAAVTDGHWAMPVKRDPFAVSPFEIQDHLAGLDIFARHTAPGLRVRLNNCMFVVQEKAFCSSEGSYCTQRLYRSSGGFAISIPEGGSEGFELDMLTPSGLGWELYRDQPLRDGIRRLVEEIRADAKLPLKPVDVGRYDTVVDARGAARLVDQTLGRATELDRALGYEANAGGTSYLNAPLDMLGSYQAGGPILNVTANRTEPGGCATTKWDDEGVLPDEFAIVKNGVLADFQTTRESAGWLKDIYAKEGKPVRSHGCAISPTALDAPLQHAPNLVLTGGRERLDFDALVGRLSKGMAIKNAGISTDFQNLNGVARGRFFEVKGGKLVARITGAGVLFRAPELWKGLMAVGGAASARRYGISTTKGEPTQSSYHSVTAVPGMFQQLTVVDALRKA
jgi:TldD protein